MSFSDRLIGTFVLCLTQIVVTEMLLGVLFKKLFTLPLFLFNISISFIVLTLSIASSRRNVTSKDYNNTKSIFLKDIFIEFKEETTRILTIIKGEVLLVCIFCLFFISVFWMVFTGYLFPSYTWDALWYHLPIVGYIIQSGAIQENATPSMIDLFINIFPKNIELFFIWNTIFLRSDVIVDLSQLIFTITGIFTVYSIACKLQIKEKHALYASLLFFFTPIVILQSTTNYIDIAVSVLFLIAINFLMYDIPATYPDNNAGVINGKKRRIAVVLSGLTTGILLGAKGSGPLFVIVLLAGITIKEFIIIFNPLKFFFSVPKTLKQKGKIITNSALFYLIYFMIPAFLIGGYWYIKNWLLYNNPVYPMEVSFFDMTLFKGLYREIIESGVESLKNLPLLSRMLHVWLERVEYYLYDSRLSGFGPLWFILLLPSIIVALFYALKEKYFNFFFASIVLGITFLVYPNNWNTRYVIFIVGLGCLSFGLTLKYFEKRQGALKLIALILVIYTLLTSNSPCIMPLKIKEFLSLPPKERIIARHAPFNIDLQARQAYGLWIWINDNMQADNVLAYTFEPLFLSPLWNRGFSNKIAYIKSEHFNEWIENLKKNQVTHILIKKDSIEDTWINKVKTFIHWSSSWLGIQERFKVVYSDVNFKVLRFQYEHGRTE
ncbi:MAG: hypothetical protein KAI96_00325 [Thermodesulfovibrionia bacterium]|nr:hypothetical protein [Thermodesulfovibrionia bacterium]